MRLRRTIAAIAVVAAGAGLAMEATAPPAGASEEPAQTGRSSAVGAPAVLLNESFRGSELHYDFTLLGQAGLTNAPDGTADAPKLGKHLKGPNAGQDQDSARAGAPLFSANPDANPGYLQLTDNNNDKVGGVIYNHPLPTSGGLDVTFEHYQYNSTTPNVPADGIGFFISDGAHPLTDPGAFGGSLGYAQKVKDQGDGAKPDPNVSTPGVENGYLGIGFDVLGNYAANSEGRGFGSFEYSAEGWGARKPNTVTLRGPMGADNLSGYERLITASLNGKGSLGHNDAEASTQERPEDAKRLVRITITPGEYPTVTVYVAFDGLQETLDNEISSRVLQYTMRDKMPPTFKFGFTGSTGDYTDVHLIRNLEVTTLVNEANPGLMLEKEAIDPASTCGGGSDVDKEVDKKAGHTTRTYQPKDKICYRFTVTNTGDTQLDEVVVTDPELNNYIETISVLGVRDSGTDKVYLYKEYELTEADVTKAMADGGKYPNTAYAKATFNKTPLSDDDSTEVPVIKPVPNPAILLEKTVAINGSNQCNSGTPGFADSVVVPVNGTPVCYRFHVTNTGNVALAILLRDETIGFTAPSGTGKLTLQPGQSTDFFATYAVSQTGGASFINTATVEGDYGDGTVSSTDNAQVSFDVPSIPLPQVGAMRDVVGTAAFCIAAALTAYLIDTSRRRRHNQVL